MRQSLEAYLDIETTGLSPQYHEITIVGIHLCDGADNRFAQLIGTDITTNSLLEALAGGRVTYTYNGKRFDLPLIGIIWEANRCRARQTFKRRCCLQPVPLNKTSQAPCFPATFRSCYYLLAYTYSVATLPIGYQ